MLNYALLIVAMFLLTACDKEKIENPNWPAGTFFDNLPMPSEKIDKINEDKKNEKYSEYSVYVNEYDYDSFHKYISQLEELGFNYEFFTTSVPENLEDLTDQTETSWGANNGNIWIRALWRSKENLYYSEYNLQLIFNNYDYMKEIPEVKTEIESGSKTTFFCPLIKKIIRINVLFIICFV